MEPRRLRFLVTGVALFLIAGTSFYFSYTSFTRQSTFNFGAGQHYRIAADLASGTTIEGEFEETTARAVNFYVMSSAQYGSYLSGAWMGSLYGIGEVISSSISYTTTARDTYYLVFTHGSGINSTQTVDFAGTFRNLNPVLLVSGLAFVALACFDLYLALRKVPQGPRPPTIGAPPPQSPPPP